MRTSQNASITKFMKTFIRSSFKFEGEQYFISTRALKLLAPNYFKKKFENIGCSFVPVESLPEKVCQSLFGEKPPGYLDKFFRNEEKHHFQSTNCDKSIKDDLKFALTQCVFDYKKYYYDFLSYHLSEDEAKLKAQTLCLMRVIKRFLEKNDRTDLLYQVFKTLECKGTIRWRNPKEFYKHVDILIRSGIYQGVLLGK